MDYYFYNLFRTAIPDYTFGILCVAIAIFVCFKAVNVIMGKQYGAIEDKSQTVNSLLAPQKTDNREKIVGVWRNKYDNIQYRIYPWGGPYLVESHALDSPRDCKYYSLHNSSDDEYRFWLEADETLTVVFNEVRDYLYIVDKDIILERISEDKLKAEKEVDKIVSETLKRIKENEED